jgi:signal transduction histidine kinase
MAGGIAHDFSNLLAVILGQTSVALEDLPPESPARSNLERAVAATRRAGAVAQQLFVYAGLGAFEYQDLLLNDLIRENVSLFRGVIPPNIELRPLLAEELPYIDADPGPIQQVVMNLILNAVEAIGPTGGSVTLSTGTRTVEGEETGPSMYTTDPLAPGRYVTLSVEDTGTGMGAESLVKIFDPFFTTKVAGRGLGLATVLGVVRAHRGGVEVESELGKGTAFRLLFPEGRRAAPVEASRKEPEQ